MSRDDSAVSMRKSLSEYMGTGDLREPHGNRDESDLHRRTVGGRIGREVPIVDEIKLV